MIQLSYAFRSLVTPYFALIAVAFYVHNNAVRLAHTDAELMWAIELQSIVLLIVGPLTAAAIAFDTSRALQPGVAHLAVTAKKKDGELRFIFLWGLIPLLITHILFTVFVMCRALMGSGNWQLSTAVVTQVVVQCASLIFFCVLGSAIGKTLPSAWASLVTVALGFLLFVGIGGGSSESFALLDLGGAVNSRLGLSYSMPYLFTQLALFTVCAAALSQVEPRLSASGPQPTVRSASIIALVMVMAIAPLAPLPSARLIANDDRPSVCTSAQPQWCTFAESPRFVSNAKQSLQPILEATAQTPYARLVPNRIEQITNYYFPASTAAELVLPLVPSDDDLPPSLWMSNLYSGLHCSQELWDNDDWVTNFFETKDPVIATWGQIAHTEDALIDVPVLSVSEVNEFVERYKSCDFH